MEIDSAAEKQPDEPVGPIGDDRGISVGRDASGNAFVTGDNNQVKVVIYQSAAQRREPEEATSTEIGANPYMGLLAFHEADADRFFGREQQISRLWERLHDLQLQSTSQPAQPRLLPVLGPSGSGKSSLARAGLIPELARRPLPGWKEARVAVLTPGSHPTEALAGVLARIAIGDRTPVEKTEEFERVMRRKSDAGFYDGLRRIADALPEIASSPLIVLVDQFEEIYSLCRDKQERITFIENLLHAASDISGRVSVVITLRTDFLGETQQHAALNTLICSDEQHVMVPAMNEQELRAAVTKPAELAGHPLDEATVALLINETKDREGALPLLQFALTRIWDGLTDGVEPAVTLKKIGGVGGALAGEAQRIYDALSKNPSDQRIAKRVFLGLVQLGEGTRDTRRRVAVKSLVSVDEDANDVERVIRCFAGRDTRLLTLSADEQGVGDTAEVTHEALFHHWDQLNDWLDENREDIRFTRRLDEEARRWDQQERADGGLWRPPNLDLLREFHGRVGNDMNPLQMDFFIASDFAEKARRAKERRQQFVLRISVGVAAAAAVVALVALASVSTERTDAKKFGISTLADAILWSPPAIAGKRIESLVGQTTTKSSLREYAVEQLQSALEKSVPASTSLDERMLLTRGKSNLTVALAALGATEHIRPRLKHSDPPVPRDPTLRSYLIHGVSQAGADAELVRAQLETEQDPSIRQALLLSLGEFDETSLPSNKREDLIPTLLEFYTNAADPGVHAAAEWLLRQWKPESLTGNVQQLNRRKSDDRRRWYMNGQGQTMVVIQGPVTFDMGSPPEESGRFDDETLQTITIDRSFAIGDKEVTNGQFRSFLEDQRYRDRDREKLTEQEIDALVESRNGASLPVLEVSWYMAAAYCNWLTEQELGVSDARSQLCYAPNDEDKFAEGMKIHQDFLDRPGYRLPTEAEWEYACRAMARTRWSHGEAEELLRRYARYGRNTPIEVGRLKPNDFGLFDMQGNAFEWCQDVYRSVYTTDNVREDLAVSDQGSRVLRGGSFYNYAAIVRSAYRDNGYPADRLNVIGFRVARTFTP